ncbi:pseudouridylate synthase [Cryomorpha ignava]|uniref:Pseudouridylate synthase n=1 Tax=Cryomorpha ignava TaxID=101383 RepID=A0A7K3WNN6_9FLAO|nr:pseudouridylate synthase [Cryomorpha ignava]
MELFHLFNRAIEIEELPEKFTYPFSYKPHPLCVEASDLLKKHLETQGEWEHNFGLQSDSESHGIGKMFGVLIVKNTDGQIGFLAAFSGGLADGTNYPGFAPPVYNSEVYNAFVDDGMREITLINNAILEKENADLAEELEKINLLKHLRKTHSVSLLNKIFDQYHFLNQAGESKTLREIFQHLLPKSPPGGAGECAAPKLLQYAFTQNMKPIALAEFWWGKNPKKVNVQHGKFYPSCIDKCKPILNHMLEGIELDEPLVEF